MNEIVIGVDIGGTNTVFGIVDSKGKVLREGSIKTTDYPEIKDFVKRLSGEITNLTASLSGAQLKGLGIGAPNGNYYKGTIELAPNLAWKGIVPLADMMQKELNIPVVLTNDANAAAVGEMLFGGARGMKDFIILTLGTGLGSGIVINGDVVYGHTGFAGECGHIIMIPGGRDCGCGRKGCLEAYVSATGIVRTVQSLLSERNDESILRNIHPQEMNSILIAEAASANDIIAVEAFNYTAEMLALAIVNAVVFSSPQAVFLFGGLANAGDLLFDPVRNFVNKGIQPIFRNTVQVLASGIPENNAAVIGAAALAWNEIN